MAGGSSKGGRASPPPPSAPLSLSLSGSNPPCPNGWLRQCRAAIEGQGGGQCIGAGHVHTHCPINCLGPAAIQHILHPEPAQKKLYKWRFSAFSFLSQGLSRFLVCSSKLFIALHRHHCPARQLADVARGGQQWWPQSAEDKETYFSPKFDPRPPVSQLSKQILYSWFPVGEQPRSGTHAFIFPSASALPIRVTERELFSTNRLFTLSGLFA